MGERDAAHHHADPEGGGCGDSTPPAASLDRRNSEHAQQERQGDRHRPFALAYKLTRPPARRDLRRRGVLRLRKLDGGRQQVGRVSGGDREREVVLAGDLEPRRTQQEGSIVLGLGPD